MNGIILGLSLVAVALTVERIYLHRQKRRLRQAEQIFVFHRLRDDLQYLAISGQVETASRLYGFLMTMLNLGIRNASTFRLSEAIRLGERNTTNAPTLESDFVSHVKLYNHDVQRFVGTCFYEFSKMLLMNDLIFGAVRIVASVAKISLRKFADSEYKIDPLLRSVSPKSAKTLKTAIEYRAISDDLRACAA